MRTVQLSPFHYLLERRSQAKAYKSLLGTFLMGFWKGLATANPPTRSRWQAAWAEAFAALHQWGAQRKVQGEAVCFFNTTAFWGGGEKWHLETATFFHQAQYCTVAVASHVLLQRLQVQNITALPMSAGKFGFLNPFKIKRLVAFFKAQKVQAVIFNGPADLKLGAIAAFLAGVPQIVYRRGIAVPTKPSLLNQFLFGAAVNKFIANSHETLQLLFGRFQFPVEKISAAVIYNGLPLSPFERLSARNAQKTIVLGNLGRLVPQKGQDLLLQAAALLHSQGLDFMLHIGGAGPSEAALKAQAQALGIAQKVVWHGFVEDVAGFMEQIDVFLLTSRWEGFGFVIAEAMASMRPVVAFQVSSNPEILETSAGFLIPPFEVGAFAQRVMDLAQNPDLRLLMGQAGRAIAQQRFHQQTQALKVAQFLGLKPIAE